MSVVSPSLEELRLDMEADFLLVDGLEPVTWQRMDDSGSLILQMAIEFALRRAAKKDIEWEKRTRTVPDVHVIPWAEEVAWHVPLRIFSNANIIPSKGDVIKDSDNTRWIIWMVQTQTFRTRYKLTCIRE